MTKLETRIDMFDNGLEPSGNQRAAPRSEGEAPKDQPASAKNGKAAAENRKTAAKTAKRGLTGRYL